VSVAEVERKSEFVGCGWTRVHFHRQKHRRSSDAGYFVYAGFCNATLEVTRAPSFEIDTEAEWWIRKKRIDTPKEACFIRSTTCAAHLIEAPLAA